MLNKPFSESCEQNKAPILEVLKSVFADKTHVLEIGSGTGQHAAWFPAYMPHLVWQSSDVAENLAGIKAWLDEARLPNTPLPLALDVRHDSWPDIKVDAVFSANTVHIMGWPEVEHCFSGIGKVLKPGGIFALYGPFSYSGKHVSQSNIDFDTWLKARDPKSGVRDFDDLNALAERNSLSFKEDIEMPVNNRILVWEKTQS